MVRYAPNGFALDGRQRHQVRIHTRPLVEDPPGHFAAQNIRDIHTILLQAVRGES